jgi:hypothetical protein
MTIPSDGDWCNVVCLLGDSRKAKTVDSGLAELVDAAVSGSPRPLYDRLTRGSGLPGVTGNLELANTFGEVCVSRGPKVDKFIIQLALLDADSAPGGTELEFLPMCGVVAVGARAVVAEPKAGPTLLGALHDAAEDLRWRVRALVPVALAGVGASQGVGLLDDLGHWLEGYFHGAAVLLALADQRWLTTIQEKDAARVVATANASFELLRGSSRSASRYPGFKALVDAVSTVPAELAMRFAPAMFECMTEWAAETKDPAIRDLVSKNLENPRLKARHAESVSAVRRALEASAPARRDPRSYVGPTRGRGKKKR